MNEHSRGLADPEYARFAWRRFRRILAWVGVVGVVAAIISVWALGWIYGPLGWVATLAAVGGVVGTVLMAGALMGLAFLSSGTGHDESIDAYDSSDD